MTMLEQIKQKILKNILIDPNTECWLWRGKIARDGYARTALYSGKTEKVPDGFMVYRKCGNILCCALDHLYPAPSGTRSAKIKLVKSGS